MDEKPVELAERVAEIALGLGIQTALIGAYALAAYHYVRGTDDIDLGSSVQVHQLYDLGRALEAAGLNAKVNHPDELDPLGGVVSVWTETNEDGDPVNPVEVVNYFNPLRPRRNPAPDAIRNALPVEGTRALRYPRLADLIALKLYRGKLRDKADVVEVLAKNRDADIEEIRATCKAYHFDVIDELIEQAAAESGR